MSESGNGTQQVICTVGGNCTLYISTCMCQNLVVVHSRTQACISIKKSFKKYNKGKNMDIFYSCYGSIHQQNSDIWWLLLHTLIAFDDDVFCSLLLCNYCVLHPWLGTSSMVAFWRLFEWPGFARHGIFVSISSVTCLDYITPGPWPAVLFGWPHVHYGLLICLCLPSPWGAQQRIGPQSPWLVVRGDF